MSNFEYEVNLRSTPIRSKLIGKIPMTNHYIDVNYNQWLAMVIDNKVVFQYYGSVCANDPRIYNI